MFLFRQQGDAGGGHWLRSWHEVGFNDFPAYPPRPDGKVLANFMTSRGFAHVQPPDHPAWGGNWNDAKREIRSGPTAQTWPWRTIVVEYTANGLRHRAPRRPPPAAAGGRVPAGSDASRAIRGPAG